MDDFVQHDFFCSVSDVVHFANPLHGLFRFQVFRNVLLACENDAVNLASYMKTRFVRFMHSLAKASQDATAKTFIFVPTQDFSKPWTDAELYARYGLTDEEIAFVEATIKPME